MRRKESFNRRFAEWDGPRIAVLPRAVSWVNEVRNAVRLSSLAEMLRKSGSGSEMWLSMSASQASKQATHSSGRSWSLHVARGNSAKAGSCEAMTACVVNSWPKRCLTPRLGDEC